MAPQQYHPGHFPSACFCPCSDALIQLRMLLHPMLRESLGVCAWRGPLGGQGVSGWAGGSGKEKKRESWGWGVSAGLGQLRQPLPTASAGCSRSGCSHCLPPLGPPPLQQPAAPACCSRRSGPLPPPLLWACSGQRQRPGICAQSLRRCNAEPSRIL